MAAGVLHLERHLLLLDSFCWSKYCLDNNSNIVYFEINFRIFSKNAIRNKERLEQNCLEYKWELEATSEKVAKVQLFDF